MKSITSSVALKEKELLPEAETLCGAARSFPRFIALMLERENALRRGRFCEETFTDLLVSSLVPFIGRHLQIAYPDEPVTGGDIDFQFVNLKTGTELTVRVQAKRLNQGRIGAHTRNIKNRRYAELLHKVPKTGAYQFRTLISDTNVVPLYAFYNHASVVDWAHGELGKRVVEGVNLAFAERIAPSLEDILVGRSETPKRIANNMRMMHLKSWFFGLDALFCAHEEDEPVPTPEAVATKLSEHWVGVGSDAGDDHPVLRKLKLNIVPKSAKGLAQFATRMAERPLVLGGEMPRPVIRFVSGYSNIDAVKVTAPPERPRIND